MLGRPFHSPILHHPDSPKMFELHPCPPPAELGFWLCGQWLRSAPPPTGGRIVQISWLWSSACGPTTTAWRARLRAPRSVGRGRRPPVPEHQPAQGPLCPSPSFSSGPSVLSQALQSGWASPVPLPTSWAVKGIAEASGPQGSGIPYLVTCSFWLGRRKAPGRGALCSLVLGWYVLGCPELRGVAYNKDPPSSGPEGEDSGSSGGNTQSLE